MLSKLLSFLKGKTRRTSRRNSRRHTRNKKGKRCNKRLRGGNYQQFTSETIQGIPLIKETFVDIPGRGAVSIREFNEYIENMDRNGTRM
jgi:hypothetical protein